MPDIDEKSLTKGQLRKLNALRKSVGDGIAEQAFAAWLKTEANAEKAEPVDRTAQLIEEALQPLLKRKYFTIPRGGYRVRRGRGRIIVEND